MAETEMILKKTESVCPECLQRVPAYRILKGGDVYLRKECPSHGVFETVVWRGLPGQDVWKRTVSPSRVPSPSPQSEKGCPFDCGICAGHRNQPCCVLLEVTQACDLLCPLCFASSGSSRAADADLETIASWYRNMLAAGGPFNIQLSGGEPSLRDDLPDIIRLGRQVGFTYFQINTNGLRLAQDEAYLEALKDAGLSVVYLQFDGTEEEIYLKMRGRNILPFKEKVIELCDKHRLGVVLVPTLVPGINTHNLGEIVRFALQRHPVVRSIHFQPVTYFGRYMLPPENDNRFTIPEILRAIVAQTDGLVQMDSFQPKGSENALCSFHATYVYMPDGKLKAITNIEQQPCCCRSANAGDGAKRSRAYVAKNWVYPADNPSGDDDAPLASNSLDGFLVRARTHMFSISGMAFQDAWNLDLELLQECCIFIMSQDGRLIPFCAYNLTNRCGEALYRHSAGVVP